MLSRRHAIRIGLTAGALGVSGATGWTAQALSSRGTRSTAAAAAVPAGPVTPFSVPLTRPPVLAPVRRSATTDYYSVVMAKARREILPGTTTELFTYNGSFPGPTIRARSGRTVVVKQVNSLSMPTSVHLHGGNNPPADDGGAMDTIAPGATRTYTYANSQPGATLWMHDHAHHMESEHVYRGLSNVYLLGDEKEDALGLPSGEFEVPLVLRDARFDANAQLVYEMDDAFNRTTILVNGRPWPVMKVKGRKYRLRLVNASNLRFFALQLSDGSPMTQIGSDGGLLEKPVPTTQLLLTPGERADLVIDFAQYRPGTQLVLKNLMGPGPVEEVGQVMRFDVGARVHDPSRVPATLTSLPAPRKATVERSFQLSMDETGATQQGFINGKGYDPNRIDTTVNWGATEVWTVTNASTLIPHNFHMHLVQFRVLERDGGPVPASEAGRKDTVVVMPGQTVKLLVTFDSHRGVFPYHCHLIDHGGMGMMANFKVV
ncbi:multicopper oxidase family protein [Streptomyces sp. NPDC059479]|uniref:multicopper oxidase family protein n=1 Tax=Streptomyces sp. NPDC059479 TaxID=3346848 RepID=UPI0036799399